MTSFIKDILPRLKDEEYFKLYRFLKKDNSLTFDTDFGFYKIEFNLNRSYDLKRDAVALEIRPVYGVKFKILSKWFEKYSFKPISDQRINPTIVDDGKTLNKQNEFHFLDSGLNFEQDYLDFKNQVLINCKEYFTKYRSVNDYFQYVVLPVLNKESKLRDVGSDWIFEYLTAVKLCQVDRFDEMLLLLKNHIEYMNNRQEPNIAMYHGKFDLIFNYLRDNEITA